MREILQFALISGYFEDRALLRKKKKERKGETLFRIRSIVRASKGINNVSTLTNENCFD